MPDTRAGIEALSDALETRPLLMEGQAAEFANPRWDEASIRVLIARLSPFEDVCRSSPHLFLFQACRSAIPDAFIDFSFFPSYSDRKLLSERSLPLMYGISSKEGMGEYDVVLISNSYTLELINLPLALSLSGIQAKRSLRDRSTVPSPLIILGGSNASASSAMLEDPFSGSGDSFVDAIFFGEGEDEVPILLSRIASGKPKGSRFTALDKARALSQAANSAPGLFFPGKKERTRQARSFFPPSMATLPAYPLLNSPEANSYKLAISSGCPSFCSFCMESWDRKPYRETPVEMIMDEARYAKKKLGASTVDIASFNFNAHSSVVRILDSLSRLFIRQNAMSQRADILSSLPGLVNFEIAGGKRSFTVGVEGVSERMRRYFSKELDSETLSALLSRLLRAGVREIKLFYIVSGFEADEDIAEFASFVKDLKRDRSDCGSSTRVVFSSGYLTRMPGTPLAFAPLALDEANLRRIAGPLKSACDTNGFEFRMPAAFDEYALGQILALGGRSLFSLLSQMAEKGYCYEKTLSRGAWDFCRGFLEETGHFGPPYLEEKAEDHRFCLEFLDFSTSASFRHGRYSSASTSLSRRKGESPSACLSASCMACGACPDDRRIKEAILSHAIAAPSLRDSEEAARLSRIKEGSGYIIARIDVPVELYGSDKAFLSAYHMRRFLGDVPGQAENILDIEECLFTAKDAAAKFPAFSGPSLFRLRAYDIEALRGSLADLPWLAAMENPAAARYSLVSADALVYGPRMDSDIGKKLEGSLSGYLCSENVAFTLNRKSSGMAHWEISKQGLRKKTVLSARLIDDERFGRSLDLKIGQNFDFSAFLKNFRSSVENGGPRYCGRLPRIRFSSINPGGMKPC